MPITYEQLTEMILTSGSHYEVQAVSRDGQTSVFRGKDVTAFLQKQDGRFHEHKVYDSSGTLIYYRDANGKLHVSDIAEQWHANQRRKDLGRAALSGLGVDRTAVRRVVKWIKMGL